MTWNEISNKLFFVKRVSMLLLRVDNNSEICETKFVYKVGPSKVISSYLIDRPTMKNRQRIILHRWFYLNKIERNCEYYYYTFYAMKLVNLHLAHAKPSREMIAMPRNLKYASLCVCVFGIFHFIYGSYNSIPALTTKSITKIILISLWTFFLHSMAKCACNTFDKHSKWLNEK